LALPGAHSATGQALVDPTLTDALPGAHAVPSILPRPQGPLDVVGGVCSTVFCLRHSPEAVAASSGGLEGRPLIGRGAAAAGPPLGGDSSDASRRRERGAKALEERLMAGKAAAAAAAGGGGGGGGAAAPPDPVDRMEAGAAGA
jgi:hypothetical protein